METMSEGMKNGLMLSMAIVAVVTMLALRTAKGTRNHSGCGVIFMLVFLLFWIAGVRAIP